MPQQSSQKFIARNRAPRVKIQYDVELYGAEKSIQLPFVVGVLADLSGNAQNAQALGAVVDRKFVTIDIDLGASSTARDGYPRSVFRGADADAMNRPK